MNLVLRERGIDPTLSEEEQLVYDAIVREHRLPGGAVRLISESSPQGEPDVQQVGEGLGGKRRAGHAPDVGAVSTAASQAVTFPAELRTFVNEQTWTFAKTMPEWPHEYIVRDRVDEGLFEALVRHIRAHGREGHFYQRAITYCCESGLVYCTMGAPLPETTIINRCRKENSYAQPLRRGHASVVEGAAVT